MTKKIDINQRIPLYTIEVALNSFLDDNYDTEYITQQLRLDYSGENRIKKALRIVNKIVQKSPIADFLIENREQIKKVLRRKEDKNIILIALLNTSFPFAFEILQTYGKFFSVQELVNTETIKKSISNIYGGNRATEVGMYSVIPMFLEADFFKRPKQGLYQWEQPLIVTANITKEIYKLSYMKNQDITEIQEYQLMDPYFLFVDIN